MRRYNFHLKKGKDLSFVMDTNSYGFVLINRFVPDYFDIGYGNPLFAKEIHALDPAEFEADCQKMIDCFNGNNLNYRDGQHCFDVLAAIVDWHIERFGRLLFPDLMTYASEMCELMAAMGYSIPVLKTFYPIAVLSCVDMFSDDVKESINGFGGRPQIFKFTDTPRYSRIAQMCPRMSAPPRI